MKHLLIVVFVALSAFGFTQQKDKNLFFGINSIGYKGDLTNSYDKWTIGASLGLQYNSLKRISGELEIIAGSIVGQNRDFTFTDKSPNTFFKTNFFSFNYSLQINLIRLDNFKLYVSQGVGLMRFSPKDEFNNKLDGQLNTRDIGEEYSNVSFSFPRKIGMHYYLPNDFGIGFQIHWQSPTSDYIDNISNWGSRSKPDNILLYKFSFYIPFPFKKSSNE